MYSLVQREIQMNVRDSFASFAGSSVLDKQTKGTNNVRQTMDTSTKT